MNLVRKGKIPEPVLDYAHFMAKLSDPGSAFIEPLAVSGREYYLLFLQDAEDTPRACLVKLFIIASIPAPASAPARIMTEFSYIRERSLPEDDSLRKSIHPLITDGEWGNRIQRDLQLIRKAKDIGSFLSLAPELT
jgi:hypothetical protein